ncbi:MAG TPA: thiamine phosphate synthase [Candidatus Acidoferrum sp.]|nr:thiamine phosphate synthase [Candidatus Acidoferrum sp.]
MRPLSECRLYAFVDTAYLHGRTPAALARQLCDGGADIIQLRAKDTPPAQIRRIAQSILPVTRKAGVPLVINDYYSIALETGAEFCHLGQEDFFGAGHTQVSQLGTSAGRSVRIGLSTHSQAQAERALAAGPDYIGVGPVHPTPTKPEAQPIAPDYLRWVAKHVPVPWFAIGGINPENLEAVLAAGVRRICVVSAILNAPDVAAACQQFKRRLAAGP